MTLPRPVLIALLGVALCAAAFLATRTANDTDGAVTTTPPVAQPTQASKPSAKSAAAKPADKAHARKAAPAPAAKPETKPATKPEVSAAKKPETAAKPAQDSDVAKVLPAIKALGRGDVVVFLFSRPGPADDTGTRRAVNSLRGDKGVSVFTVGLEDLETYRPVLAGAGVSQVPAVVVVRGGEKARLLQGFVDARTLRQTVADARR
jgi:hypothetical protein